MVFADLFFIYIFLPLCLLSYLLARGLPAKNTVLIVFSLIFYAWGEPLWILLLVFSSFLNWAIGLLIERGRETGGAKAAVAGNWAAMGIHLAVVTGWAAMVLLGAAALFRWKMVEC